ncbi:MAG: molybdopterin-dependent oxidoreductase [Proteobacteria bacterium]|nr:molybdopterin-dependent oxidoreductase [Pseudomonadota bacterium]
MSAEIQTVLKGEQFFRCTSSLDCGGRCPLKVYVKNGVIDRIEGDDHIDSEKQLRACLRGRAYRHFVHHPDRLKYPMKRVGKRGEKKYERISWDEAMDTIVSQLNRVKETYGNKALFFSSAGHMGALHTAGSLAKALAMFGGFTTLYGNISSEGAVYAVMSSYGDVMVGHGREDLLNTKLIIMWGWDPVRMISGTDCIYNLTKAKEKGIKIIAIDPRYTHSGAVFADEWIPIIPGTDAAMMAAMANIIVKNNLHDQTFIDKYSVGFEVYRDYVLGNDDGVEKTPAWASKICGVPAERIESLAIEYASAKPACLMDCQGPARASMGEQYNRAAITMTTMTGNVGKPGGSACGGLMGIPFGHMFRSAGVPGMRNPTEAGGPSIRGTLDLNLRLVRRIHTNRIFDAILEGTAAGYPADLKAAWFAGGNLMTQRGNLNKGDRALKSLEFTVGQDLFLTPTMRYCDIVLPVASFAEKNELTRPWPSGPYLTYSNKAIEPLGECKTDWEIGNLFAEKMGFENFNEHDEDQWLRLFIQHNPEYKEHIKEYDEFKKEGIYRIPMDETYVAFRKQIEDPQNHKFNTPTGKIELFSQRLADLDDPMIPPVAKYVISPEDRNDPLMEKYPLQLLSPHPRVRVHSTLQNVDWLMETEPHAMWINPVDAEYRGIRDGDEVFVFNDRGKLAITAWVTRRIIPGVISIYEGTYYEPDEEGICRGGCVNVLTNDTYSPGGAAALKSALVEVTPT